uniref:oligoendopeptidase F n=1 Tax=Ndongobacter massiliensis TaxID=1871025 RepID=UPI000931946F|nr:oligoendopeptidase F [Ndongobacter massiliensis]
MEKIKMRSEVDVNETWDLTDLFATEEIYEQSLDTVEEEGRLFAETYKGNLKDAKTINAALDAYRPLLEMMHRLSTYAELDREADLLSDKAAKRYASCMARLADLSAKLAFLDVELSQAVDVVLEEARSASAENANYLAEVQKKKPHLLSQAEEGLLAALEPTLESPYQTYSDIKFGDTEFPAFEVNGKCYEMTYNSFEGHMEHENDYTLRRKAFEVFSKTLDGQKNGTASVYNTQVQKERILAHLRGYDSVFDMLLDEQDVPRPLYDRQIDVIMKELAPAMRRYAKLLAKIHHIEDMSTADLKLEVDPTYAPSVTFEEARDYVIEGLSVLGEDYGKMLRAAFAERWIDYAENKGKRTGAFCASPYGCHSYVLTSFNGKMDEVMTLAHELGHAGHFYLAGRHQNILNTRCSMYFVESPSTTNEVLMEQHLLKKVGNDKRMRRWVLSQIISKTYYHNFVTHLLEAAYQREVYKIVDAGGSVDAKTLSAIYRRVLKEFWGEEVKILPGSTLTWMRQPHYYMGMYPYTYSAGLTIGTQMAQRILSEGDHVAKEWLDVLAMGGTKTPVELAAAAGVDITTEEPLRKTIAFISDIIDEIIALTEEMEG